MKRKDTAGYKIRLIHNQMHKTMEAKRSVNEEQFSLTGMQRWAMGFLKDHEAQDVYQRDIEAEFKVSRATASNMLAVMERNGLIARLPVEHDARLKKIVLTEQGKNLMERVRSDVREMEDTIVKGFSEEERDTFHAMLDRILDNLGVDVENVTRCCDKRGEKHK